MVTSLDISPKLKVNNVKLRQLPEDLYSFATIFIGNFIFVIGGRPSAKRVSTNMYRYDILKNEWLILAKMPSGRIRHVAALCNNSILVVGGADLQASVVQTVFSYDIANNTWSEKNQFSKPIAGAAACNGDGEIYLSGGYTKYNVYNSVYQYDGMQSTKNVNTFFENHNFLCD